MSNKRGMHLALVTTAVGAVLVLATASQPRWAIESGSMPGGGAPAATALALVALAGLGLLVLLRGRARSVVGLLLLVVGVGVVLVNLRVGSTGWFGYSLGGDQAPDLHRSPWFWLTATGGVLTAIGGGVIAAYGHRWPTSRRDYRATPAATPARRDTWTALDRGEDPTL